MWPFWSSSWPTTTNTFSRYPYKSPDVLACRGSYHPIVDVYHRDSCLSLLAKVPEDLKARVQCKIEALSRGREVGVASLSSPSSSPPIPPSLLLPVLSLHPPTPPPSSSSHPSFPLPHPPPLTIVSPLLTYLLFLPSSLPSSLSYPYLLILLLYLLSPPSSSSRIQTPVRVCSRSVSESRASSMSLRPGPPPSWPSWLSWRGLPLTRACLPSLGTSASSR